MASFFERVNNTRLTIKFLGISVGTLALFAAGFFGLLLPRMEEQLIGVHKEELHAIVGTVQSLLTEYDKQVQRGELSTEEAKRRALHRINTLRYGSGDYFWINDLTAPIPTMIMHPTVPSLDGTVLSDPKFNCATALQSGLEGELGPYPGKAGNLFQAMLEATRSTGMGYVTYLWPKPKGTGGVTEQRFPKLSYAVRFPAWGWMIGSGVYIDSIDVKVAQMRWWGMAMLAGIFVGALLLTALMTRAFVGRQVDALVHFSGKVAGGELSAEVPGVVFHGELRALKDSLASMVEKLRQTLALADEKSREAHIQAQAAHEQASLAEQARHQAEDARHQGEMEAVAVMGEAGEGIRQVASELSQLMEDAAQGTSRQRERAESTSRAVENLSGNLAQMASMASGAAELAGQASGRARTGTDVVTRSARAIEDVNVQARALSTSMAELGTQSQAIGAILTTIADIADQTNLLALNAAIEAARAGESGRGFAVVADEVRKLAEKTMTATKEVATAVRAIQDGARDNVARMDQAAQAIGQATSLAHESGQVFGEIADIVRKSADESSAIAQSAESQSAAVRDLAGSMDAIAQMAGDVARNAAESLEAVSRLESEQEHLSKVVAHISDQDGPAKARKG